MKTYLVDDIMTKVDRMSMAVSLESREPLLDHKLLEFAAMVPSGLKLKDGRSKYLLRRLLERRVPKTIVDRPKHGFEAPIGEWLRGPLAPMVDALLLDGRLRDRGVFDAGAIARVWRQHRDGTEDHRHRLWSLVMLELWFRQFVDGGAQASSAAARQRKRCAALPASLPWIGSTPDAPSRALRMRDVIAHRGPDEAGLRCDAQAALAHRRLSIVDLSTGQQPLANEDGTVWVVFNGEIYNHADVRADLLARGHVYRTRSDTETIVHAYEQWGEECVHRFRGMFAFAVWDAPRRRLLLVRDRLGVKPLYWCRTRDALLFGSEIKALVASELIRAEPN